MQLCPRKELDKHSNIYVLTVDINNIVGHSITGRLAQVGICGEETIMVVTSRAQVTRAERIL
jgi:hypothetical protein